ncbi:uncharacterized protein LOC107023462 [Solanum pennellii]|uniref:Uncharacterized protein LOC107023462 n=1 Tax=Solanum pennellii TaxID=28526 RepID=A0ABM1H302_SOLPN|nr:uncharacterized protein LOC107023462 [Solanum pennellii]
MTHKDGTESENEDAQTQMVAQESVPTEEVKMLRQQMTEMYEAWMNGQAPLPSIREYLNANMPFPIQVSTSDPVYPPGFGPYINTSNTAGTSSENPLKPSKMNNPLFMPTVQTNTIPQPTLVQKSNDDPILKDQYGQGYAPKLTSNVPNSYHHQYSSPVEVEKNIKNEEHEEIARKMRSLEQNIRNMQGLRGHKSVSFKDLCMFPVVHLALGFKTPKFDNYNGHGDPVAHLRRFCNQLRGARGKEELLMAYFVEILTGVASEWFIDQDISHWHVWDDMTQDFVQQFQHNIDIIPDHNSLANMKKKPSESFKEYAIRWREQAATVKPPMKYYELVDVFLQAQEPDYFHYLLAATGKPFAEAIKIEEMVENGIKSGKIVSQAAIRATTQAIQSGSGNFTNRKKEEGSMRASGSRGVQLGMNNPYGQVQQEQYNSPQHYYPSQYAVLNTQAYVRPPSRQQWWGPAPQVKPVNPYVVNPNARGFDTTVICEYHANALGHSTENCWTLKRVIEKLIEDKVIEVRNEEAPNVTNNPLPAHNNECVVGMVDIFEDYEQTSRTKVESKVSKEESSMVLEPIQRAPIIVKGACSNIGKSRKLVLYVPESIKREDVPLNEPKCYIPGKFSMFDQNQESMKEPVVIQIATQLPITNTKVILWNYNKVVVTHKGKEIIKETNETRGLTRSERCYAPEELKRDKQIKENQLPIKKPVTEEDAEEFLKMMKAQDYSVIDQLRKTPAQISLSSFLIHSKEHCEVLTRILNEAHISENITVSHLEKMVNQIFEVNRITFTDDELPLEGSGHNRALHLTVKCEEHYVKRVMVDGGSGVDICPLSTLQSLKISTDRIRTNNVCVRAFDGAKRDTLGELYLIVAIGPAEFGITFQVIDMDTSYNLLLGRPWIHMARAVPSTLHQVVKFEHDKQEIIVHGEVDLPITRDPSIPCIEAKRGCESLNY